MADADRSLKMAKVLLSGGFAEEVLPLLVKSLRGMALALSANRGEAAATAGGDGDIRRLVEQAALPAEALTILDAANPAVMPATAGGVEPLIAATGRIWQQSGETNPASTWVRPESAARTRRQTVPASPARIQRRLNRNNGGALAPATRASLAARAPDRCLPLFTSGRVRLIDDKKLVTQFSSLERRTSSVGRDRVDHGRDGHDDHCNAAAGALTLAGGAQYL